RPDAAPPELVGAKSLHIEDGPFTSDLSGQDFVTLLRAGYRPVELALGNCVYEIARQPVGSTWLQGNIELKTYTQACYTPRETTMQTRGRALSAQSPAGPPDPPAGMGGMTSEEKAPAGEENVIESPAYGTAIAKLPPNAPRRAPELPAPQVVIPLDV